MNSTKSHFQPLDFTTPPTRPVSHLLPIPIVKQRLFTDLFLARLINPSKLYIFPSVYIDQ